MIKSNFSINGDTKVSFAIEKNGVNSLDLDSADKDNPGIDFELTDDSTVTPVEAIFGESAEAEDGEVMVFTLQGVRVDAENLAPGSYIVRRSSDVRKIAIR